MKLFRSAYSVMVTYCFGMTSKELLASQLPTLWSAAISRVCTRPISIFTQSCQVKKKSVFLQKPVLRSSSILKKREQVD